MKYERIKEGDKQQLVPVGSTDDRERTDDAYNYHDLDDTRENTERSSSSFSYGSSSGLNDYLSNSADRNKTSWWFQQPAVKRNKWVVVMSFLLVFIGIASFIGRIASEILYHTGMSDILRGLVFFIASGLVMIPGVYAILHIYLAAKRIGRVRFSSVWFFRE